MNPNTFEIGDRVEWYKPGEGPYNRSGTLVSGPRRTITEAMWVIRWVSDDLTRPYEDEVSELYIRKPARRLHKSICVYHDGPIEWDGDRWVDVKGGDDGGTFDWCPDSPHITDAEPLQPHKARN